MAVQQWIDTGGLKGGFAIKGEGISEIHRRFRELLPEDLLWVEDLTTKERIRSLPVNSASAMYRRATGCRACFRRSPRRYQPAQVIEQAVPEGVMPVEPAD